MDLNLLMLCILGGDMFGGEFGEFDLGGGEFGGGMEDIEVPRNTRSIGFGEDKDLANENDLQVSSIHTPSHF